MMEKDGSDEKNTFDYLSIIVDGEDILGCVILDRYLRLIAEYPPNFSKSLPTNIVNSCSLLDKVGDYLVLEHHDDRNGEAKFIIILLPSHSVMILKVRPDIAGETIARELVRLVLSDVDTLFVRTPALSEEAKRHLLKILEDVIVRRFGNAMYISLRSYVGARSGGKNLLELMLQSPRELVKMLADYLGGSTETAMHFLETIVRGIHEELGITPIIDLREALKNLMKGDEEGFKNLILEVVLRLELEHKRSNTSYLSVKTTASGGYHEVM